MAVFLINICKFNGCGITFPSLGDLIQHIEDTHIDYDPQVIEQKEQSRPACLPLSYVLRFITDAARKEGPFLGTSGAELKRKLAIKHHSYSMSSSNRSNTPTDLGSEMDEDEMMVSESEDSNDSWTTEEFSSEFIMRYGSRHSGPIGNSSSNEKPFACPVPGCKKRYKNVNGIKYHSKNGHKKDGKVRKGYKCHCGKSYKTSQGLKNHSQMSHNNNNNSINNNNNNNNINNNNTNQNATHHNNSNGTMVVADNATTATTAVANVVSMSSSPPSQSGSLSPSSASNTSGGSSSSINQSQLSPNSNSISSSSNHHNHHQQQHHQNHHQTASNNNSNSMKNNFGLVSLKTSKNGSSSSSSSSANQQKNCGGSVADANDLHGLKMGLPSLINLGILTPATSPKQPQSSSHLNSQQQQPPPQHHHHAQQHNNNNHHNHHHQNHHNNNNNQINPTIGSNNNNSNNNDCLPLTPISPNMNRNVNFHNNNNAAGTDNITTDET